MNKSKFTIEKNTLTVERLFDAPNELVWRTWTEVELLDKWWAPKPWKSETKEMNFKEGGERFYAMVGPSGEKHWCLTKYNEIIQLKNFTGKDFFCDENKNINKKFPVSDFLVKFEPLGDQTQVTMISNYPSEEDLQKIIQMGMQEGLTMTLEELERILKEIK